MDAGALSRAWNVGGCVGGHQHLVDDMDDAVAGVDVGQRDVRAVDHDAVAYGERERLTVDGFGRHAVGKRCGRDITGHDVVEQDVRKGGFAFGGVKGCEVNTRIGERLIGRGKDREWTRPLKGFQKFSLHHCRHQRVVNSRALGGSRDVVRSIAWREHLVNDMNDTVAGGNVGEGDVGVVDHDAVAHRKGKRLSVCSGGCHAVGYVGCWHLSTDDVVEQDVREGGFPFRRVESSQVNAGVSKSLVGWCEHCERT